MKVRNGEMVKRLLGSSLEAAGGSGITESWKIGANARADGYCSCSVKSAYLEVGMGSLTPVFSRSASGLVLGSLGILRVESFIWRLFYLNMCRGFVSLV